MINKTPSNPDHFPVPVAGQEIPRGWFARLVSFMNSLVLHGDNQYLAVKHDTNGTTIYPTNALITALNRSGSPPSAGGGGIRYGIEATVSGGTASVALVPGSTVTSLSLIPTAPVTITGGSNGELIIGSTASGGGGGDTSYVYMSTGPVLLNADSVNYYYCPQAYTSQGNILNAYDFADANSRANAISAIETAAGVTISDTTGYTDDDGNTLLILPKNPAHLTRVVINAAPVSGRAVVVTADEKRIVDSYGDPQGTVNGYCTDQIYGSVRNLYLFINSLSGWPQYVYDDTGMGDETNKSTIQSCIANDGGCWMKIELNF